MRVKSQFFNKNKFFDCRDHQNGILPWRQYHRASWRHHHWASLWPIRPLWLDRAQSFSPTRELLHVWSDQQHTRCHQCCSASWCRSYSFGVQWCIGTWKLWMHHQWCHPIHKTSNFLSKQAEYRIPLNNRLFMSAIEIVCYSDALWITEKCVVVTEVCPPNTRLALSFTNDPLSFYQIKFLNLSTFY